MDNVEIIIFPEEDELFHYAAQDFMQRAITSVTAKNKFTVVLAGGNTPKSFFSLLASDPYRDAIPWSQIEFFFGDERYVPADDEQSNYHMAKIFLFSKVPVNKKNIFRLKTEFVNPDDAAQDYEQTLRQVFKIHDDAIPVFDLVYLGLGDDAHTASIMPKSDLVKEIVNGKISPTQLVATVYLKETEMFRLTLTPNVFNQANQVIFIEKGEKKAKAVKHVLEDNYNPLHYPAQLIQCAHSKTIWYLDATAGQAL